MYISLTAVAVGLSYVAISEDREYPCLRRLRGELTQTDVLAQVLSIQLRALLLECQR